MLHHVSFNADDPEAAAQALSDVLCAQPVQAPTPPFPAGSWFVCAFDGHGSYLEVLPRGHVFDPEAPGGIARDNRPPARSGFHVLLGSPRPHEEVVAIAARAGWRCEPAATPFFSLLKLWIDDCQLVEILPRDQMTAYLAAFGPPGAGALDRRLRRFETGVA